jgi:hypothetical protein
MSDITDLIQSIDTLTLAIKTLSEATPENINTKTPNQPLAKNTTNKTGKKKNTKPTGDSQDIKPGKTAIDTLNKLCIQKATDVPNAKLLIQHRLLEIYKVKGLGDLPETLYEEFSTFVQAITGEDVQVFISSQQSQTTGGSYEQTNI